MSRGKKSIFSRKFSGKLAKVRFQENQYVMHKTKDLLRYTPSLDFFSLRLKELKQLLTNEPVIFKHLPKPQWLQSGLFHSLFKKQNSFSFSKCVWDWQAVKVEQILVFSENAKILCSTWFTKSAVASRGAPRDKKFFHGSFLTY